MLWLELKKLALAGIRLAAGCFLALAMLNLGLGASAVVTDRTLDAAGPANGSNPTAPGQVSAGELLHLQFFGFWHVHESLNHAENLTSAGVTEYDDGLIPSPPVRFSYLNPGNRLDSDYSSGAALKSLTDFPDPQQLAGIAPLSLLTYHALTDDWPVANPFLKIPLKPPIF